MNTYHSVFILVTFSTIFFLHHLGWGVILFVYKRELQLHQVTPFKRSHKCFCKQLKVWICSWQRDTVSLSLLKVSQIETFTQYPGLSNNRVFFTVQTFNPRHKSIQYLQKCNRLRAALTRWVFVWCTNRNRVSTIFSVFYSYFQVANHNPPPTFLATNV